MVHILENKINQIKTTTIISQQLKEALIEQCHKRLGNIESVTNLAIATILDPRFKKIYFKSSVALSKALSAISDTLKKPADHLKRLPTPCLIGVYIVIL